VLPSDPTADAAFGQPVDFEFMSADKWLAFHCELYDVVGELALPVTRIDPGVVHLRDGRSLGLLQLAQHCHLRLRDEWHDLISSHLLTMVTHLDDDVEPYSAIDLRIRLVPDTPADAETFCRFGARPYAEGVVQLLAVHMTDAVRCVPESEIEARGWDVDDAWRSAVIQTEMLERPDELHVIDIGDATFIHVFGERPFIASMVGVLDQLIDTAAHIGEFGAIVSIPSRHSILVHPIDGIADQNAIDAMIPIARQLYRQGPGSVSPHLYWWREGEMMWIPTFFEGDQDGLHVESFPPPELADVIDAA